MRPCTVACTLLVAAIAVPIIAEEAPADALEKARIFAAESRFSEAYALLSPHVTTTPTDEISWEIAAEAGRAAFHLGMYEEALAILRPVVRARPVVLEPALYLGATSFILGHRDQALVVLESVLASGTRDLYLAVTLPGEKAFLADPEVRALLERYAVTLPVDLDAGSCLGLHLGQPRAEVASILGAGPGDGNLGARAGPEMVWNWAFTPTGILDEVTLHPRNLERYTPYRILIQDILRASATPADALAALGPPEKSFRADESLVLRWKGRRVALDLIFRPEDDAGADRDELHLVRLYRLREPTPEHGEEPHTGNSH